MPAVAVVNTVVNTLLQRALASLNGMVPSKMYSNTPLVLLSFSSFCAQIENVYVLLASKTVGRSPGRCSYYQAVHRLDAGPREPAACVADGFGIRRIV